MWRVKFQFILFMGVLSMTVCAQDDYIRFHNIGLADGLSHSLVFTFLEDDLGFLWFGTQDGLNRYDGYEFKVYHAGKSNRSPSKTGSRTFIKTISTRYGSFMRGTGLTVLIPCMKCSIHISLTA